MTKARYILLTFASVVLYSCTQQSNSKKIAGATDSLQSSVFNKEKVAAEKLTVFESENYNDSLAFDKVLKNAIEVAKQNTGVSRFRKKYVETMPDSSYQVEVSLKVDNFFTTQNQHLIIWRNTPGEVYIDIYSLNDYQYHKELSHVESNMTYMNDTIRDINGDDMKDFVVNWYGSSGCCLRGFSNVYLMRPDKQTFSHSFEFINPTFSPKEKIIRGVEYGQLGDTELYKYRWVGEAVDTIEYVSYARNDRGEKTGKIIVTNNLSPGNQQKILRSLNHAPVEYRTITGYDWFTGSGYR